MNFERELELRKRLARAKLVGQRARAESARLKRTRLEEQRARWEKSVRLDEHARAERTRAVTARLERAQLEKQHAQLEERARLEEWAARLKLGRLEERAQTERGRVEGARLERARSEERRARWERRALLEARAQLEERAQSQEKRARSKHVRSSHLLLAIAVRLLPPSERDRYLEEFRAELLDVTDTRLSHAMSLLRGVLVLRLHRGLRKEAADAAVRRAKD
jgi:hypothetical protein